MDKGKDTTCINFRMVINDAACHTWEPMPEVQPPTVTALLAYLVECEWDHKAVSLDATFGEGTMLRLGMRKQFWLPTDITPEEETLLESFQEEPETCVCPFCKGKMVFSSTLTAGSLESNYNVVCEKCDIRISMNRGIAWTPKHIARIINKANKDPQ